VGKAAITEAARSFMVAFPDMQVLMDDLRLDGGRAEYRWTLVGTNTGPGGTGHKVRISGFEDWKIGADGLIAASPGHSIKPTTTANSGRASARNAGFDQFGVGGDAGTGSSRRTTARGSDTSTSRVS